MSKILKLIISSKNMISVINFILSLKSYFSKSFKIKNFIIFVLSFIIGLLSLTMLKYTFLEKKDQQLNIKYENIENITIQIGNKVYSLKHIVDYYQNNNKN